MSTGTIYYVKQDNTIWGCGEADCCGEYYEEIDETFFECEHDIPESEMTDEHLQSCNGGGEVVEWRKADRFELLAFNAGKSDGFQEGSDWGIEWQTERIIRLLQDPYWHNLRSPGIHEDCKMCETIWLINDRNIL